MRSIISALLLFTVPFLYAQESAPVIFKIFSDPHYFDASLGTTGKAFEDYLSHDRKLLRESDELLQEIVTDIISSDASFVLVPGDLTKDGERSSHLRFAAYMREIEATGRKVFVLPGNHDVLNGEARSFLDDSSQRVQNISPADFKDIYAQFGYGEAIERDPHSLSYVAEPSEGIWLLALDACRYLENPEDGHPLTDGRFNGESLGWIMKVLEKARSEGRMVIAMMHHGVIEHYKGQEKHYGEYLVDDYPEIGGLLAANGVKVVFTGHYHAQDIAFMDYGKNTFLFDIETGSLVTYPCPVRTITLNGQQMQIRSDFISSTPSHPYNFREYSYDYGHNGIAGIAERTLTGMHLRPDDAARLSGQVATAFCVHYGGDEPGTDHPLDMKGVNLLGRFIISFRKSLVKGLYTDTGPADNQVTLDLEDGTWE